MSVFLLFYGITFGMILSTMFILPHPFDTYRPLHIIIIAFASVLLTKYLYYMIVSPWHDVWVTHTQKYWKKKNPDYAPLVSVLIPAWNEEVGIIGTIDSVLKSSYDRIEVVVVNDGSKDNSDKMIRDFKKHFDALPAVQRKDKTIVYQYQENTGKGGALNRAIALASGDILMSVDADCQVLRHTVRNFVEYFRNPKIMAAVGNVKIGNTQNLIGTVQYMEFLFSFYFKKADSLMNTIYIIGGAAGAFRREVFETLGGYNTKNVTEDIELSIRIQDAGMRIVYAADAVVYTEGASDLKGLMSQRLRWKHGRFETFHAYIHMFFSLRERHNKTLTMVIMPLAIFQEVQLFFEFGFLAFLYFYALTSADFSSFISGIIVVSSMFIVQMLFDDKETRKLNFLLLAPIAWLLFYSSTFVETNALIRSIWGSIRKKEITWQSWQRQGVFS